LLTKLKRLDRGKIVTVLITVFMAWATGFAMQNSDSIAEIFGRKEGPPLQHVRLASADMNGETDDVFVSSTALPSLPASMLRSGFPAVRLTGSAGLLFPQKETVSAGILENEARFSPFGIACGPRLSAIAARERAEVRLMLDAPCKAEQIVEILHEGLVFTELTSRTGHVSVTVPALAEKARFTVRFADRTMVHAMAEVPEVIDHDRIVLLWQGNADLNIRALEFGADYGDVGHVQAEAPGHAAGRDEVRGIIMRLGRSDRPENVRHAEIYSFPRAMSNRSGAVRLALEAGVNAFTCDREIEATALWKTVAGVMRPTDIVLFMPGCNRIGNRLVLKNVLPDLKIARN